MLEYFAHAKLESGGDVKVESVKEMAHRGSNSGTMRRDASGHPGRD